MLRQTNDNLASGFDRNSKTKDFDTNSALDSGCISGPQTSYSDELESGCIDSAPMISTPNEKLQQSIEMLDSGLCLSSQCMSGDNIDAELNEKFNNLSCKESNNLEATKDNTKPMNSIEANLWKLCYRQDNDGDTQLHLAIINEIPHIINAIIRITPAPWLLDMKNDDAQAPIHLAVLTNQPDVVRHLLVAGAKTSIRDGDGNTALHLACIRGDLKMVETILKPIAPAELAKYSQTAHQLPQMTSPGSLDLEQRNFYGENCIHIAAQRNHIDILRVLVRERADVNAREGRAGYTPLHIAIEQKNVKLASYLLESCTNLHIDTQNYRRVTAYQLACELESSEMMEMLAKNGCAVISPPSSDYDDSNESDDDSDSDSD